jgi:hypothetical protein
MEPVPALTAAIMYSAFFWFRRRVFLRQPDVSEEHIAYIFGVEQ